MHYCSRCGNFINNMTRFCPYCGQLNQVNGTSINQQPAIRQISPNKNVSSMKQITVGVTIACCIIIITVVIILTGNNTSAVYFPNENNVATNETIEETSNQTKKGETSINYDNKYVLNTNTTVSSVLELIVEDSESQKSKCSNDIIEIEKRIINNYKINSVNLCELNKEFALEIEKIVKYIYNEYPTARGHLSYLSLGNFDADQGSMIAFFQPYGAFTSSTVDRYTGYRMRIILNTKFYLNETYFENTIISSVRANHFPANANKYSPLIHEFGHYLSFIAVNKYYRTNPTIVDINDYTTLEFKALLDWCSGNTSKKMAQEAYDNYKNKTNTRLSFDEFRGSISGYALAKNNNGEYIYDETIAEAFHDYYLNGDKAADASKEIMSILRKYLEM